MAYLGLCVQNTSLIKKWKAVLAGIRAVMPGQKAVLAGLGPGSVFDQAIQGLLICLI